MKSIDFDVVICGAGPVGLSVAGLLRQRGMPAARIAIVDAKPATQAAQDPRSLALSYGSRQILEEIGAWSGMTAAANEIHCIHVSRRGHFGRTLIRREDYDLSALGYVLRYGAMVSALTAVLDDSGMTVVRPARVTTIDESGPGLEVRLGDGRALNAAIVVQAEGGVFSEQSAKLLQRDYKQTAIVAHVAVTQNRDHWAFERFTAEGPLALLPDNDGYALVWCARPDTASRLLALDDAAFLQTLGQTFGERLGYFSKVGPRNSYPLGLNAQPFASSRIVAVGNAAQTLHPVAGQGLNLGLRDAKVLSGLLSRDCSPAALAQFAGRRRDDRRLTIGLTDIMARVFASAPDGSASQTVLGCTLGLLDVLPPAKRLLAQQFIFGWR